MCSGQESNLLPYGHDSYVNPINRYVVSSSSLCNPELPRLALRRLTTHHSVAWHVTLSLSPIHHQDFLRRETSKHSWLCFSHCSHLKHFCRPASQCPKQLDTEGIEPSITVLLVGFNLWLSMAYPKKRCSTAPHLRAWRSSPFRLRWEPQSLQVSLAELRTFSRGSRGHQRVLPL